MNNCEWLWGLITWRSGRQDYFVTSGSCWFFPDPCLNHFSPALTVGARLPCVSQGKLISVAFCQPLWAPEITFNTVSVNGESHQSRSDIFVLLRCIYCAEVSPQPYKTYLMISNKEKASLPVTHVKEEEEEKKKATYIRGSLKHTDALRFNSAQGNLVGLVLFDGWCWSPTQLLCASRAGFTRRET